ncbi:MAG: hypothetical protein KH366_10645 [Clostridiaceae bacterium]|nr:hypothetical protein [Clostridiaceae bacterium]
MVNKKKDSAPPAEKPEICYICGREISGDHVYIKTKRHTELHIHFGCMRGEGHGGSEKIL